MRSVLLSVLCLIEVSFGLAKEVIVEFELIPSESFTEVSLSTGGSHSRIVIYTGAFRARISYDESTLAPERFTFMDGRIAVSDSTHTLNSNIPFTDLGTFNTTLTVRSEGLAALPSTNNNFTTFDEEGNFLNIEQHLFILNEGSATISVTILGETVSETSDLAIDSIVGPFARSARLEIEEVSKTETTQDLRFTLTYDNGSDSSEILDGSSAVIRTVETGSVTSVGEIELLTDFGDWLLDNGWNPDSPPEIGPGGLPVKVLYAFNLPRHSNVWPISVYSDGHLNVVLHLPSRGLKATLLPEISNSMEKDSWRAMPIEYLLDGVHSLQFGASGFSTIRLSNNETQYLRFRTVF